MAKILLTTIGGSSPGTKPLATSILSAILKTKGHDVILFDTTFMDMGFSLVSETSDKLVQFKKVDWEKYGLVRDTNIDAKDEFLELIRKEEPDMMFASAMSDMMNYTIEFMRLAKEHVDMPTVLGGIHATLLPDDVIGHDCIDYVCVGEGENVVNDLVEAISSKSDASNVKNIWYRKNGQIVKNERASTVELDSLPFLDYSIYDNRQFLRPFEGRILRSGDIQDMRGCPRRCTYCANSRLNILYPKGAKRFYSPKRFVEEAKYLAKTYNLDFFKFFSEDMFLRKEEDLSKLSELYKKEVNLPFTTHAHPDSVTPKKAELVKNMNCASVTIALECGNHQYRRDMLKRKYSNSKFNKSIKLLQDNSLRASVLCMIGLPYESRKMIFETIEMCRTTKPKHSNCGIFFPYLSTPLGELCLKERFIDEEEVKRSKFDDTRTLLKMPQILPEEIEGIRKMWSFYINYPKLFYPLFNFCEKESKLSDSILTILRRVEFTLKKIRSRS